MKELTHRDEIHGDVEYDPLSVALLDTPTLQRLGRVYQLGYGHLVYRGGTHTRLSHSMGTYAAAARLVDALRQNYEGRSRPRGALPQEDFLPRGPARPSDGGEPLKLSLEAERAEANTDEVVDRWSVLRHLVCWAALLHDVGHVPLGHTLEDEFEGIYQRHDDFSSPRLSHLWLGPRGGGDSDIRTVLMRSELYPEAFQRLQITSGEDVWASVLLICVWKEKIEKGKRTSFQEILRTSIAEQGKELPFAERLLAVIERVSPWLFAPYMADIVANTISADYLDYLRRDPHNLGLDVLKDDRVVSRFWVGADHLGQNRMALSLEDRRGKPRLDTCTGVVELVRQRYRFAEIVYYHKTKVAASAMLAKVFHIIGKPPETPGPRETPTLERAGDIADKLIGATRSSARAKRLRELQAMYTPTALLDPEVGDESLDILLRTRALHALTDAVKAEDRKVAGDALRAITLLDALGRRELYKVAFSMNAQQFRALKGSTRSTPKQEVERCLGELIDQLRNDPDVRAKVEANMVAGAIDWPAQSLLLYVPPRKSQAKGIETGALADGRVVTLGAHPAVEDAVKDLGNHYEKLWRLIVLAHPERIGDAVGLSDAVDAFVNEQFPDSDLQKPATVAAIEDSCWFSYVRSDLRIAARRYGQLIKLAGREPTRWERLSEFDSLIRGRSGDEELAAGAALLDELQSRGDTRKARQQLKQFTTPGALQDRLKAIRENVVGAASREGEQGEQEPREMLRAIEALADELCR